jgi:hypothetical protein
MELVNLTELREMAAEYGDTRLTAMNDRELLATALENYYGQDFAEAVIRGRAVKAQGNAK